jgi:hypothetical protein
MGNGADAGIDHLGRRGVGTKAACGDRRAHVTLAKGDFRLSPRQCARCEAKLAKWDQIKERSRLSAKGG